VVALSVNNDDNARWLTQRPHRLFGSSIDVDPKVKRDYRGEP
jgi:hypothetical protein